MSHDTNNTELRNKIDARLNSMIEQFYQEVPNGTYQRDSQTINHEYYKRHSIETVLRIRHKRMIDALVIHYFTKHDPKQAKAWAQYIDDEMLHGHMFGKDIERLFGLKMDEIYEYEPLLATKLLNGYFYYTLEHEGPMAALVSAYFLEYTTRMTQPVWLDNLARIFGEENIRGARAHVNHDIKEDHNDFVWNVLSSTIKQPEDAQKLLDHLNTIYGLFAAYFTELHMKTINMNESDSIRNFIPPTVIHHAHNKSLC
jgi:hypothetical protein